jgi:hypothetical protein
MYMNKCIHIHTGNLIPVFITVSCSSPPLGIIYIYLYTYLYKFIYIDEHIYTYSYRELDPSSCQGVMLLLWALINRQFLAINFVSSNGIAMLLAFPFKSAYLDSSTMLTLIIQRYMHIY